MVGTKHRRTHIFHLGVQVLSQYIQHRGCQSFAFLGEVLPYTFNTEMEGANDHAAWQTVVQQLLFHQMRVYDLSHLLSRGALNLIFSVNTEELVREDSVQQHMSRCAHFS